MSPFPPNNNLPDQMPEEWLNQIRGILSQDKWKLILTTFLGSSVIAALVTFGANYFLKNHEADVEIQKEARKEKITSYKNLSAKLNGFSKALNTTYLNCHFAVQQPSNKELAGYSLRTFPELFSRMNDVSTAIDQNIDVQISDRVNKMLDAVAEKLSQARQNSQQCIFLVEIYNKNLEKEIGEILKQIEMTKSSL